MAFVEELSERLLEEASEGTDVKSRGRERVRRCERPNFGRHKCRLRLHNRKTMWGRLFRCSRRYSRRLMHKMDWTMQRT